MKLKANIREKKERLDQKRVAAILYGPGVENKSLSLDQVELEKMYKKAGESNLIDLEVGENKAVKVLIKDIQKHYIKGSIIHADFYQVNMDKKITTEIPLNFINTSKAEKEKGALVMKNMDFVEVECLPTDLVNSIDIDLSLLENMGDLINVSDLKAPQGMRILNDGTEAIASAIEPKQEEVEEEKIEEKTEEEKKGEKTEEEKKGEKTEEEKKGEKVSEKKK
jgi:large subunit ribosomal protein L25